LLNTQYVYNIIIDLLENFYIKEYSFFFKKKIYIYINKWLITINILFNNFVKLKMNKILKELKLKLVK